MLDVSLSMHRGAFHVELAARLSSPVTGIFGASGSGKSTLLSVIAGLIKPNQGRIVLDNTVLVDTAHSVFIPAHQRHIGLVFQDGQLFPHLSVRQNLLYGWQRLQPSERRFNLDEIAGMLEIEPLLERQPRQLSGGEKQRVAVGRAILYSPRLLLLDEPLSSLDDRRKQQILPFLVRIRDETNIPMLYVSHSLAEIQYLTDDILYLAEGKQIFGDSANQA